MLALGAIRTWQAAETHRPRPSERFARSLLEVRSSRLPIAGVPVRDDAFAAGVAVVAFGTILVRKFAR